MLGGQDGEVQDRTKLQEQSFWGMVFTETAKHGLFQALPKQARAFVELLINNSNRDAAIHANLNVVTPIVTLPEKNPKSIF